MYFQLSLLALLLGSTLAGNPYTGEVGTGPKWMDTVHAFEKQAAQFGSLLKAVFVGDAFIEQWQHQGAPVWTANYQLLLTGNLGINDDRTENVLWRVENATISAALAPKVLVLMVGGANVARNDSVPDIAKGIQNILHVLARILPHTKVILSSVLPRNSVTQDTAVHELNKLIHQFADDSKVYYLDLASHFETGLGKLKVELYDSVDVNHLSLEGYKTWHEVMKPLFTKLIA